ncbi:MAG: RNA polymerase sigma factor [Bacteroidota bacterium]
MAGDLDLARTRLVEAVSRDRSDLTRFARSRLGRLEDSGAEAEDVVADVVLRLFERADVLAQVENLTAYLFRAVGNALVDRFRRRRPQGEMPERVDPGPTPEEALAQAQLRHRLDAALQRLSPAERSVWVAVEIDGIPFRRLAEDWGEPIGTLLSRKARAAKSLRKLLAADHPDAKGNPT